MGINTVKVQAHTPVEDEGLKPRYLEAVSRVERLHRRLLDLVKDEFDRMGWDDINPVQAIMMFNIGNSELTAGELRSRGYYLGSNVSYNLKKSWLIRATSSKQSQKLTVVQCAFA